MIDENVIKRWQQEITTRKCPVCGHLTLNMEPSKGRIHCTSCDFEEEFPVME